MQIRCWNVWSNNESILLWNSLPITPQNPHKLVVVELTYNLGWTFQGSGANRQKVWFFRDDNLKASPRLGCRFIIIANQSYALLRQSFQLFGSTNHLKAVQNLIWVYWHWANHSLGFIDSKVLFMEHYQIMNDNSH